MELKQRDDQASSKEELKRLREKTDKGELAELKRGLMGGYRKNEVDQYVSRLKAQLQTAERTYKGHIAELSGEKDRLRGERDELLARVAAFESAAGASAEAKEAGDALRAANESLGTQMDELRELFRGLEEERDALRGQIDALTLERETADAGLRGQIRGLEARLEEKEEETVSLSRKLEAAEKKLARKADETGEVKKQLADTQRENCRLSERSASMERENEGLVAQLDLARQNILHLLSDKEAVDGANAALRDSLNSLVVKADAVVKENAVLNTRLEEERGRARQYRSTHEKLSDALARVRVACSMLDERVLEADKTLQWGAENPINRQRAAAVPEQPDLSPGYTEMLRSIVSEMNGIRGNLARYRRHAPDDVPENDAEAYAAVTPEEDMAMD